MTVQVHYYGSVFNLDPRFTDRTWTTMIGEMISVQRRLAEKDPAHRGTIMLRSWIDGRPRIVHLPYVDGMPLVLVLEADPDNEVTEATWEEPFPDGIA